MALQAIFDPTVKRFDQAICLWLHGCSEEMLDAEVIARLFELMLSVDSTLSLAKQPVGEGVSNVG